MEDKVEPDEQLDTADSPCLLISIHGEFRLVDMDGVVRTPRGKKACAILAMLFVAPDASRSREWLRQHLWSDRGDIEGGSSLRQCLSEIRRALGPHVDFLESNRRMVNLRNGSFIEQRSGGGDFLEDLSIRDPAFNIWRDQWEKPKFQQPQLDSNSKLGSIKTSTLEAAQSAIATYVLPLVSVTVDQQSNMRRTAHLAHRIRQELTAHKWLRVAAFGFTGPVKYRLNMRIEEAQEQPIALDLCDGDGALLWTMREDDPTKTVSATQGNFYKAPFWQHASGNVADLINQHEEVSASTSPSDDITNIIWRGRWHLHNMQKDEAILAHKLFERAAESASDDINVLIERANAGMVRAWVFGAPAEELESVSQMARTITARDPTDARGYCILGVAQSLLRNRMQARIAIAEALRLCPTMTMALVQHGCNLLHEANYEAAETAFHIALSVGRYDRRRYVPLGDLAMTQLLKGEFARAIEAAENALAVRPKYWYAQAIHGVACFRDGRGAETKQSFKRLREIRPNITGKEFQWLPNEDAAAMDLLVSDVLANLKNTD